MPTLGSLGKYFVKKKSKQAQKQKGKIFFNVRGRTLLTGENLQKIFGIKLIGKENSFCDLDYWLGVQAKLKEKENKTPAITLSGMEGD